jgi:hypothetical protein
MAKRDSQTITAKGNPLKVAGRYTPKDEHVALTTYVLSLSDLLTACRWGLRSRSFSGDLGSSQVDYVRTMFETIVCELEKFEDATYFGDVVEQRPVEQGVHRLRGLLYLMDESLQSITLGGSIGHEAQPVTRDGVGRLFDLICQAFDGLRLAVDRELGEVGSGPNSYHGEHLACGHAGKVA